MLTSFKTTPILTVVPSSLAPKCVFQRLAPPVALLAPPTLQMSRLLHLLHLLPPPSQVDALAYGCSCKVATRKCKILCDLYLSWKQHAKSSFSANQHVEQPSCRVLHDARRSKASAQAVRKLSVSSSCYDCCSSDLLQLPLLAQYH